MATAVLLAGGAALAASLTGTSGDDTIEGTDQADMIDGGTGGDKLSGLAGDDQLYGGGWDKLFAGDSAQNPLTGNDLLSGQDGNDTVLGAAGVDDLRGGPGNDTIVDGPFNDASTDTIYGGADDDTINSANVPARKDVVYCGPGTDAVEADPEDIVSADCENPSTFTPPANDPTAAESGADAAEFMPDPSEPLTEYPEGAQPGLDESGFKYFKCTLPPQWKGNKYCTYLNGVYDGEYVAIGLSRQQEGTCRDLNFIAWAEGKYLGVSRLDECSDRYDIIYGGGKVWSGPRTVRVYGRSAGPHYTSVSAYLD